MFPPNPLVLNYQSLFVNIIRSYWSGGHEAEDISSSWDYTVIFPLLSTTTARFHLQSPWRLDWYQYSYHAVLFSLLRHLILFCFYLLHLSCFLHTPEIVFLSMQFHQYSFNTTLNIFLKRGLYFFIILWQQWIVPVKMIYPKSTWFYSSSYI